MIKNRGTGFLLVVVVLVLGLIWMRVVNKNEFFRHFNYTTVWLIQRRRGPTAALGE